MRRRFSLIVVLAAALLLTLPVGAQIITPSPQGINAVSSAITDCASLNCATWAVPTNAPSLTIGLVGTMTSMTVTFEATINNVTWVAIRVTKLGDGTQSTTTTATGQYAVANTGLVGLRVRCTTYSSGTVNATLSRGSASSALRLYDLSTVTGTLGATNGGTGLATVTQGDVIYGSAANTWSALAKDTNSTRYLGNTGSSNSPAWAQVALATGVSGTLPSTNGGTGVATVAQGDVIYGSATNTWSALAKDTNATRVLTNTGTTNNPAWAQVALGTGVSGTLPIANGGTGAATSAAYTVFGNFTGATAAPSYTAGASPITLYASVVSTGSTGGGGLTQVDTFTLPSSTTTGVMGTDGQDLAVHACAKHAANTNSTTFTPSILGQAMTGLTVANSGGVGCGQWFVTRTSSSTATIWGSEHSSSGFVQDRFLITGLDWTSASANIIKYSVNAPTSTNDLIGNNLHIVWQP